MTSAAPFPPRSLGWARPGRASRYVLYRRFPHVARVKRNAVTVRVGQLEVVVTKETFLGDFTGSHPIFQQYRPVRFEIPPGLAIDHQVEVLIGKSGALPEVARSQREWGVIILRKQQDVCSPAQFDDGHVREYSNLPQSQVAIKLITYVKVGDLHDEMTKGGGGQAPSFFLVCV